MTGTRRLSAAITLVLLGSFGGGTAFAVEPQQTTGQAASSSGAKGDGSQPGVTQLNEGSACGTTGGSAAAGGGPAQGPQAAPSKCPAGEATGKPQPKQ